MGCSQCTPCNPLVHPKVAVADFGLSRKVAMTDLGGFSMSKNGPVCWQAPEAMATQNYSKQTDAFMLGVTLWEMVAGRMPWQWLQHVGEVWEKVKSGQRLPMPLNTDPVLGDLIIRCWAHDPRERPPIANGRGHTGVRDRLLGRRHALLEEERLAEAEVAAVAAAIAGQVLFKVTKQHSKCESAHARAVHLRTIDDKFIVRLLD